VLGQSTLSALHCPITAPIHLALGHGSTGVLILAVVWTLQSARPREPNERRRAEPLD
jgi:hypothetical protein